MTDYTFNTTSLAQIMREIFIHLINQIPAEDMPRDEAFWKAHEQLVPIRKHVLAAYNGQSFKVGDELALSHEVAMVAYRFIVEENKSREKFLKLKRRKLIQKAIAHQRSTS